MRTRMLDAHSRGGARVGCFRGEECTHSGEMRPPLGTHIVWHCAIWTLFSGSISYLWPAPVVCSSACLHRRTPRIRIRARASRVRGGCSMGAVHALEQHRTWAFRDVAWDSVVIMGPTHWCPRHSNKQASRWIGLRVRGSTKQDSNMLCVRTEQPGPCMNGVLCAARG